MPLAASIVTALVALLHAWFLVLEMFMWDKPLGRRTFRLTPEFAAQSKNLAANQGLYNGFLVAGLVWALVSQRADVAMFFLGCVVIAGIFGGFTVSRRILAIQALPAAVALGLLFI
ncbi:DUF1304 domain-containing protein [Dyella sp.]|uniref:DUF1304 domain-containing protein n=1 Tax=Dyella sp. TaxID=1869338 RepID=UPI002ED2A932